MDLFSWPWLLVTLLAAAAVALLVLWLRSRRALEDVTNSLSAVADDPGNTTQLAARGPIEPHAPVLNRVLHRLRSSSLRADLHDVALASLKPEEILQAAAERATAIAATDEIEAASATCIRFDRERDLIAQSHSRLPDGSRDLVVLSVDETDLSETGPLASAQSRSLRLTRKEQLPSYLTNLDRLLNGSNLVLDVIPLRTAPASTGGSNELLGALVLGREDGGDPVRFDQARSLLALSRSIAHALATCQRKIRSEKLANDALMALARASDSTSSFTRGHSERVAQLAFRLGQVLGLVPSELERLRRAALLHDLGSVAISQRLLDQEDAYDEEDRSLMRPHVELGVSILRPASSLADVLPVIEQHHEWWNGDGYPQGLSGDAIDPLARILTVVDVYEALTSTRPYRRALEPGRALAHIEERAGSQFEPRVVAALAHTLRGPSEPASSDHRSAQASDH